MNDDPKRQPMQTRLVKIGDEEAVLLTEDMLELVGATPETAFRVTTDGRAIVLTPVRGHDGSSS